MIFFYFSLSNSSFLINLGNVGAFYFLYEIIDGKV